MLIILVGHSGAGKSTFVKAMDCPDHYYEISGPIKKELRDKDLPVNHDTIQPIQHQRYTINPFWQIPFITEAMKGKSFLIIDGPRSLSEVLRLMELYPDSLIIKIETKPSVRNQRLRTRDGTNNDAFNRIEHDEKEITNLEQILKLAEITIENNGYLERLQEIARKFCLLLN